MQIGVLSDIHGNRIALEAVLSDMPAVDRLVCAGDIVGYNPWHADCIEILRDRSIRSVMGNHDRAVAENSPFAFNHQAAAAVEHAHDQLTSSQLEWVRTLPDELSLFDGRLKLVHGHPADPDRYTYPEEFSPQLLGDESVLVLGHTHVQHHEQFDEGVVMNPGSVGQPRDGDPRAAYAVLDLDARTVTEHRVSYDVESVVSAVRDTGLPEQIGTRLRNGT